MRISLPPSRLLVSLTVVANRPAGRPATRAARATTGLPQPARRRALHRLGSKDIWRPALSGGAITIDKALSRSPPPLNLDIGKTSMNDLKHIWLIVLLFLCALPGSVACAADDDGVRGPTPPWLSYIDGEVSYWRPGADEWARARANLALAEGDAFYAGRDANFEVQ